MVGATEIKINPGRYFNYYHIEFELNPNQYSVNTEYGFTARGQFEVFVPKELFPIPAPKCRNNIIIRMPASFSSSVRKKRKLYDSLLNSERIRVILKINPFVEVVRQEPLALELTHGNVFFRQKNDNYHDRL